MTKKIENIELLSDGVVNPITNIHEEKLWKIFFEDSDTRLLGRNQMTHYLSKGTVPAKTVHSFKKWDITTTLGSQVRTWVIVYDDKSHVQLVNKDFYSLISNGHKNEMEEIKEKHTSPTNPVLFTEKVTTVEEKKEVEEFRNRVIGEIKNKEELPGYYKNEDVSI